jgi:NhaP-type Na+/H+ or K+/H+ antiporter
MLLRLGATLLCLWLPRVSCNQFVTDDGHAIDDHYAAVDAHHGDDHHAHHSDEFGQVLIFFLTVGLCIGAITDFTLSRFGIKVAYTVVMFFEGILFGFLLNNAALGKTFSVKLSSCCE